MGCRISKSCRRLVIGLLAGAGAVLHAGCEEGLPPTYSIPPHGGPLDFLPEGVTLGTAHTTDSLYYYDSGRFAQYAPVPGTATRYIKRGQVLSVQGATQVQIQFPADSVPGSDGQVLHDMYSKPYLFGFEPATMGQTGFLPRARRAGLPPEFLPLAADVGPSWWDYNHVQFLWTRRDTLVGRGDASTGSGWILRSMNLRRPPGSGQPDTFIPTFYTSDALVDVIPGTGIFLRGWTLTAERNEVFPEGTFGQPRTQRNPRFLWMSKGSLGSSLGGPPNPNESEVTTTDQCVDGMWGDLQFFAVQMAAEDSFQVGDRWTTWTYVSADSAEIRRRATRGTEREQLRCSGTGSVPPDVEGRVDNPLFPVFYLSVLARYEFAVEEIYDQLEWKLGNAIVGRYPSDIDGVNDVVKLVATVTLGAPQELLVQRVDLYLQRGIGTVVQVTGIPKVFGGTDLFDVSRLRACLVNGQNPPKPFFYADQ